MNLSYPRPSQPDFTALIQQAVAYLRDSETSNALSVIQRLFAYAAESPEWQKTIWERFQAVAQGGKQIALIKLIEDEARKQLIVKQNEIAELVKQVAQIEKDAANLKTRMALWNELAQMQKSDLLEAYTWLDSFTNLEKRWDLTQEELKEELNRLEEVLV